MAATTPVSPSAAWTSRQPAAEAELAGKNIRIETAKGTIEFELFGKDAPKAVSNFIFLVNDGFYDGLSFHRRDEGFVIQGGDPSGDGTGGPGYEFEDEEVTKSYDKGIVAMANAGPDTNGSQFFINTADNNSLDAKHTVFGKVTAGMDVVASIENVPTEGPDRPVQDVIIEKIELNPRL